jgi:hypothetical protein
MRWEAIWPPGTRFTQIRTAMAIYVHEAQRPASSLSRQP